MAAAGSALELTLPGGATVTREVAEEFDSFDLAIGPFENGEIPVQAIEGAVSKRAWRLDVQDATTLQLLAPLRDQIAAQGYETLFECHANTCGGFDFRFNADVMPAPDMYVDLFDFRYLAARKNGPDGMPQVVSILVSRAAGAGYLQVNSVNAGAVEATEEIYELSNGEETGGTELPVETTIQVLSLAQMLEQRGHVVLDDLEFETGSSALAAKTYDSLEALAAFVLADPARRIALVGHTDSVGSGEVNIALSRRRAASVVALLVDEYSIPRSQLEAGGMGYLSPVAPNTTPEGRDANRRVEAVLLNTK